MVRREVSHLLRYRYAPTRRFHNSCINLHKQEVRIFSSVVRACTNPPNHSEGWGLSYRKREGLSSSMRVVLLSDPTIANTIMNARAPLSYGGPFDFIFIPPSSMSLALYFPWAIVFLLTWITLRALQRKEKAPLPPGPPSDPIIGHLRLLLRPQDDAVFYEWQKRYGMVFSLGPHPY